MKTTEEYAYQLSLELFKNCETFKEKEAAIEDSLESCIEVHNFWHTYSGIQPKLRFG